MSKVKRGTIGKEKRTLHPNSKENLRLGPESLMQGNKPKARHNFTLLDETVEWLQKHPSASAKIDEVVRQIREGHLVAVQEVPNTKEKIADLQKELKQIRGKLKKVVKLLDEALPLPANRGGAIKDKIKEALAILD
ncbi:hypothetical protein [Nostoc sp. WHI]|uniref:hypothetical protein n=1 Tax=Nostoc sp. WHI TaxID=2650611 RepID=UPI0018C59344|nr:hypothetical protein [Nostoc sp. WHI]MBG1266338.1 hypothetical protein [Nostoc sp. WHI]